MKIVMTAGCGHDSIKVDGKELNCMNDDERQMVLNHLCGVLPPSDLATVLGALTQLYAQYSTLRSCDDGGDVVETFHWTL